MDSTTIKILLADDHAILRQALRNVLEQEPDMTVVAEASTGYEALELAKETMPDVAVVDISMPALDGVNTTRRLVADIPAVKILAVSVHVEQHFVAQMVMAGASGYVAKTAEMTEVIRAIRTLSDGGRYLSPEAAHAMADAVRSRGKCGGPLRDVLGARERQVLTLLAQGNTSQQIGSKLHIACGTVDVHRRNIMQKLDLHTVPELTQYAIREGLIVL